VHKADQPALIADLANADILTGKDGAEIDFATSDAEATALGDGDGFVAEGILEFAKAVILSGQW
jgi:hypothetical protein